MLNRLAIVITTLSKEKNTTLWKILSAMMCGICGLAMQPRIPISIVGYSDAILMMKVSLLGAHSYTQQLRSLVTTFDEYEKFLPQQGIKQGHLFDKFMPVGDAKAQLDEIKGHLVWMPLRFLSKAEMAEKGMQVRFMIVFIGLIT